MPMYWESGGGWALTNELSVWDGAWLPVKACWIWDGGGWALTHVAPTLLTSFSVLNSGSGCDPTIGNFRASWTTSSGDIGSWSITLEYSFDGGSSWSVYASGIDPTSSPFIDTMDGISGFTSLDSTSFRLSLLQSTVHAISSPWSVFPTYACF